MPSKSCLEVEVLGRKLIKAINLTPTPTPRPFGVEVLGRKLIKPSNPTPRELRKLGLSLFDQLVPPLYFNIILYYAADATGDAAERRAQLEKSLSESLPSFFLVAGRFNEDDFSIDCGDQGVEFVEARVNCRLSDFLQRGPKIELLDKLLPWESPPEVKSSSSPLLGIQVNAFDCGALVLGISINHIIADAASMWEFVNAWTTACRASSSNREICQTPNFHHYIAPLFPARLSLEEKAQLPLPPVTKPATEHPDKESKIVTARFLFNETVIANIKEFAAESKEGSIADIKSTKVVVALALLWKALMALAEAKHGYKRDSVLAVAMNLRGRVSLQIPEHSFGNFCASIVVPFEAKKNKVELYDLMVLLTNAIRDMSTRVGQASSVEDVASILIESRRGLTKIWESERDGMIDVYRCSSWRGFPLYEAEFGWGKPFWVSVATQWGQGVWLMDANNGDGIEVWVSLKEKDMIEFKQDPSILAFLSSQL